MPARRLSSLDPILEEVRREREIQVKHADSMDAKAGIILGFAGALVALFPEGGFLIDAARVAAVGSGLLALWTFWPRSLPAQNPHEVWHQYGEAEPEFTKLRLVDTHIETLATLREDVQRKTGRLKASMVTLAQATLLAGLGLVVD